MNSHESDTGTRNTTNNHYYNDRILSEIGNTIENSNENLIENLNLIIERAFRLISKSNLNNPNIQKEIFDQILLFINALFKNLDIKKFYNNIPKTGIQKYSKKTIGEQFIHNIYGKHWELFFRDEIEGGSCSYWTVLFKHFFDELEKRGIKLKSEIFFYQNGGGHSGVIILFQNKEYLIDFGGFNHAIDNSMIQSVDSLKEKYNHDTTFDSFKRENIQKFHKLHSKNNELLFFNNTQAFTNKWQNTKQKYAKIEFYPKLDGETSKNVNFEFRPDEIHLTIDNTEHIFTYKNDVENTLNIPNEKFFDYLISHIEHVETINITTKETLHITGEKNIFTKYLTLIRKKINIEKLRQIYKI